MKHLTLFLLIFLSSCSSHTEKHHHHETEKHHHHEGITMTPEQAKAVGVVVEKVTPASFHGVIHTSGRVIAASCDETTVVATITGRVDHGEHLSEGMRINSGAHLFTITSAGMQVADGDPVQRARIEYEKSKRDYNRAELLIKDHIISEKDFQLAKAEYESAKLTYNSISRNRSEGGTVVTAPKGGFVKQVMVKNGDYVEAGQPLMVITQNQHLYLRAEVPERHWNELNSITCAKFRTSYSNRLYDITDMGGHIQSYGRSADQENAYIPVIFEFNNTGDVVQGSFAEIYLITDKRNNVLTLPITAITEEQGVHYAYIQEDEDGYHRQEVTLGTSDGERVEILKGIKSGDKVVTKGAVQLKLASATNAIPAHNHNH